MKGERRLCAPSSVIVVGASTGFEFSMARACAQARARFTCLRRLVNAPSIV